MLSVWANELLLTVYRLLITIGGCWIDYDIAFHEKTGLRQADFAFLRKAIFLVHFPKHAATVATLPSALLSELL
jgi:hypothetical protein